LTGDRTRLQVVLDRLAIDREAAEAAVSQDDRQIYQSLRRRKRGMAVARLEDGACSACGVSPSSSRAQAARHDDELTFCGNCERILYAV
jgi:predicted  nucleic acid-binding Zn-ribbon protein